MEDRKLVFQRGEDQPFLAGSGALELHLDPGPVAGETVLGQVLAHLGLDPILAGPHAGHQGLFSFKTPPRLSFIDLADTGLTEA